MRNGLSIGLMAVAFSAVLGGPLGAVLERVGVQTAILILLVNIGVAIMADIISTAATAASPEPFNAMASHKVPGAREGLLIARNAPKVNSIFSDVIGDISGTVSGLVAAPLIITLKSEYPQIPSTVIGIVVVSLISFLTIGGKAVEKGFAVQNSTFVILWVGKVIYFLKKIRLWPT